MGDEMKRDSWFVRAAAAVGDLGNPFYREERRRDVWNEASAVGFQLMLWLGLAAAGAMIWIGGPPALPYVLVVIGVVGVPSLVSSIYAARLGVRATEGARMSWWRMAPVLVLLLVMAAGLLVRGSSDGVSASTLWGVVAGGVAVVGLMSWTEIRARRRESTADDVAA
ncbi:hypothetical protein Ae406Ps2_1879c [Pseudonocardia sp. Ae406_Ps2]|uniref:hypothetical protein n=1 Tax=unclassified Pseudonocardia TaxID=2619320 RepID=UPI00094AB0E4|nr:MULTISPECIES: hypothetical protein [unclassified Pseudonocardia]OLM01879.1 hypothetical protein Ae406Ps2_1879c [Pseudonocardia sp. Ae406_Ps2]OLM06340.1 hypothetical protein Ae331Ps2_4050 [Pseudonocardia sp. Ae331_Ps2]OLM13074.1 hypothetical protein Ae505Ps2_3202 [Pseudonocardia sp. Ae505_Ps2]OLM23451.1 hypothetical protein Ae706Ps2_1884c [Pseudonocardia sp. Ae706_Ps2]OLM32504.1 hypothetical protein Ae717Ps2_3399c [Pseudonocardia sp. Ae717_Ps2]